MGKDFTKTVYEKLGKDTFKKMIEIPPNTRETKGSSIISQKIESVIIGRRI